MEPLAAQLIESLRRGEVAPRALEAAGEAEPGPAGEALAAAAADRDLGPSLESWLPGLLVSARPGFGARCLLDLARGERERGGRLEPDRMPLLPRLLGSSNFLARLLLRRREWLTDLEGRLPEAPDPRPVEPEWNAIRRTKYRGLLRVAARDLAGRPLPGSLAELSELADRCLAAALAAAGAETGAPAPALFALGKLGGRELNFSSDVDLLFVSDPPPGDAAAHHRAVTRLIRHLKRGLEVPSEEGFGYRIDLELRPEGPTGVLVNPVDAALSYYETYGAEWERQMLIRLRFVAGAERSAEAFAAGVAPFVYRRLIDPGVLRAVREMKARIEEQRRRAGRDLEADLKEGPGGIRDVEFLVQSFQLFFGARHRELRTGHVLEALGALAKLGMLPEQVAGALAQAYTWLRRAEHAVQLAEEQQSAAFPRERAAQVALARRLGYADPEAERARNRLLDEWTAVRTEVRAHFEALVLDPGA